MGLDSKKIRGNIFWRC